jgi:nucleoside-diphosphate-sugar epimerase
LARTSQLCVLGESGLLGSALACRAANAAMQSGATQSQATLTGCQALDSRRLLEQLREGDNDVIESMVARASGPQDWIYAAGIIDPKVRPDLLDFVNAEAPLFLHRALSRAMTNLRRPLGSLRFVTFGSVLEDRPVLAAANPYIRSKAKLFQNFSQRDPVSGNGVNWIHMRLNTLYGSRPPPPFMFLGQMDAALRARAPFAMSAGQQLREYHHADDVADNVLNYLCTASPVRDLIALNNGRPIRIGALAASIFEHFGLGHLLHIGAVDAQPGEVFAAGAERSPHVVADRDAIEGIIGWLTDIGIKRVSA